GAGEPGIPPAPTSGTAPRISRGRSRSCSTRTPGMSSATGPNPSAGMTSATEPNASASAWSGHAAIPAAVPASQSGRRISRAISDARNASLVGTRRASSACSDVASEYIDADSAARTTAISSRIRGDYDRAMVGISLLTLGPGELGGSETYVRELLRGLGRVGELSYRVLLPPVAPDASEGLPAEIATEYRRARTIPERLTAMTAAAAHPGPL